MGAGRRIDHGYLVQPSTTRIRYSASVRTEASQVRLNIKAGYAMFLTICRHGGLVRLVALSLCWWGATVRAEDHPSVATRTFDIDYSVAEEAHPLDAVDLWYTTDKGQTWRHYGSDDDRQSPIVFHAPSEGLFGFFVVATNAAGASSPEPQAGTEPHEWAFVDYTPPVVQIHPPRQVTRMGDRVLQVRWTAIDTHLPARPVELAYRRSGDGPWLPVVGEPLANTGSYDWRLPADLQDTVVVRVSVRDRSGHRVLRESDPIAILPAAAHAASDEVRGPQPTSPYARDVAGEKDKASSNAQAHAARLYDEAIDYRDRGDYRAAITRLRRAVRIDPQMTDAFAEMADMLYLLGDYDLALSAYEITLGQDPKRRSALRGSAKVFRQRRQYDRAAARLRTILRYNPGDAEVWMNLGDIAIYQRDELLARECYTRATQIDPQAIDVINDARQRLALMDEVSRAYRKTGP